MELQHLRYFLDVARLESVSRAAELNHVAQPAMSRVIALLEQELGAKLFDRVGRVIRLNANGRILMEAAKQSLSTLDAVQERINFQQGQMTGQVKICLQSPLSNFGAVCREFRGVYPLVELDIEKSALDDEVELTPGHDIFIYMGPAKHNGHYQSVRLLSEGLVALVSRENPLAQREELCLSDLAHQEFVMPQVYKLKELLVASCYQSGFVPQKIGIANHPSGQKMLVDTLPERRAVVALKAFTEPWGEEYKLLEITDPCSRIPVSMAWSQSAPLRPSAEAFRDYMLDYYLSTQARE